MPLLSRRHILAGATALAVPDWARGANMAMPHGTGPLLRAGFDEVRGPAIDLSIGAGHRMIEGRSGHGIAVNGSVPGPLLRLREGEDIEITVHNTLVEDSSIHWHGLLLPFQYDGVPGVSFPGIAPGKSFTYRFKVRQAGTYWWHSHSGLQEQSGHYGPIIIDPKGPDRQAPDRDYVLLLSEFTPIHPHSIMNRLKKGEGYFNYQQLTASDAYPLSGADRRMWTQMRMLPTDISDVTGSTYTYLANGRGPNEGLEYAFKPGERIRLRLINGSAMTFFNVRIPGLPMTVVAADGQDVRPIEVDELQIGVAETYDVVVTPGSAAAYAIIGEAMDRSGFALATLASAPGLRAGLPPRRPPPLLTMADMGMDHGPGSHSMAGMKMRDTSLLPPDVAIGPGIDMVSMNPVDRMGDPGIGLNDVGHRVLTYKQLAARTPRTMVRTPTRLLEIHLTGNMERYMWSFDGRKYAAVTDDPIRFAYDERVRVRLINNTMMAHPIHLHGHFFELVNGAEGAEQPLKHTMIVQPGGSAQFDLTADAPGDWAFHCHLLYHMHAGMMQVVTVAAPPVAA
jgi:FtsP/CotA-like multicopper oxidase with cupredoxin domain